MKNNEIKIYSTDVLIAGGSGAALSAAKAAAKSGAEIIIVSKGKIGRSGNSLIASASFSDKVNLEELVMQSHYISDQDIASVYAEKAPAVTRQLAQDIRDTGGPLLRLPTGWFTSGPAIGKALKKAAASDKITFLEDIMITDILKSGERACGAVGFDVVSGDIIVFKAKSVILATGGFQPFSFKSTVSDMTGDGPAAAFRAGCRLADMEFHLFIPTMLSPAPLKGSIFPFIIYMADLFNISIENELNENFMLSVPDDIIKLSQNSKWSKMVFAYYWQKEIDEGRGSKNGGIYFRLHNSPFFKTRLGLIKSRVLLKKTYGNKFKYQGNDFSSIPEMLKNEEKWEVGLSSEYSNGGVLVSPDMRSDIDGLFAAGESASGTFGALRIYEGLTEMLVLGEIAGQSAADYAKNCESAEPDQESLNNAVSRIKKYSTPSSCSRTASVAGLTEKLKQAADTGLGLYKNEKAIRNSLETVQKIITELSNNLKICGSGKYKLETVRAFQLENLLICTEAGLISALDRKESRGMHIRSDYPEVDNMNHLHRNLIKQEPSGMKIEHLVPDFRYFQPETRKYDNLMHFALSCEKKRTEK